MEPITRTNPRDRETATGGDLARRKRRLRRLRQERAEVLVDAPTPLRRRLERLSESPTENAFASAKARRWYFANLAADKATGGGGRGLAARLRFGKNPKPETAGFVNQILEGAKAKGVDVGRLNVKVDTKLANRAGRYMFDDDEIELTEHYVRQYHDPRARSSEVPGWSSVSRYQHPESSLVHEAGHAEHAQKLKGEFGETDARKLFVEWSRLVRGGGVPTLDGTRVGTSGFKKVASQVSQYAAANPLEFVAEVYTARKYGREFPNVVNALYDALGGP